MDGVIMKLVLILIGAVLAWLIGVDTSDIPLAQITGGQVFRNLAALYVFYLFCVMACAEHELQNHPLR